jgi:hypothetical protein
MHAPQGYFYAPTIIADASIEMKIFREETFGPAVPLFKFGSDAEAVQLANDTEYGLAAYFFTTVRKWGSAPMPPGSPLLAPCMLGGSQHVAGNASAGAHARGSTGSPLFSRLCWSLMVGSAACEGCLPRGSAAVEQSDPLTLYLRRT